MHLRKSQPEEIHTNRISKFETKSNLSTPGRFSEIVSQLVPGQRVSTTKFGDAIIDEICNMGENVISILVKGTAGMRRETIYPLHITKIHPTE